MKSSDFIVSALQIFQEKKSTKERYSGETDWLKERKNKWNNDKIRIGVIGVTSSGKSTLINALLGEELLATALKPASSQLVSCSKGDTRKVIISFQDEKQIIFEGNNIRKESLKKYSDERGNPENQKKVSNIEIITPRFDLDKDVILIDSAGLDAYNLESHEKLSLEVLLPTIDLCIFVTTLKTNSDAKTRSVLNSIAKHECPVFIVQNMLDSVVASADGSKTKAMVAKEHKERLKKIIRESNIKNKDKVEIVQISALYAAKARCLKEDIEKNQRNSNYNEFKKTINAMIKEFKPALDMQRKKSIHSRYEKLIKEESAIIRGSINIEEEFEFKGYSDKLNKDMKLVTHKLRQEILALSTDEIKKTVSGKINKKNIDKELDKIKNQVKKCESNILDLISGFNDKITYLSKTLNIPIRDISVVTKINQIPEPIKVLEEKESYRLVEKKGMVSKFARFIASRSASTIGYREEKFTTTKVNETRTYEEIKRYMDHAYTTYEQTINSWLNNIGKTVKAINHEIYQMNESYNLRKMEIEENSDVLWILKELDALLKKLNIDKKYNQVNLTEKKFKDKNTDKKLIKTKMTNYQKGIVDISRIILQKINGSTLEIAKNHVKAPKKQIIISWDFDSMNDFSWRFLGQGILEKYKKTIIEGNIFKIGNISYVYSPNINSMGKIKNDKEASSIFVLVNVHQDGSTKNEIKKLILNKNIKKEDKIFFVVQDFISVIEDDTIREMRANLTDYYREFQIDKYKGILLINDENPIFNMAFVQSQINPCLTAADDTKLIQVLNKHFNYLFYGNANKIIADLIREDQIGGKNEI